MEVKAVLVVLAASVSCVLSDSAANKTRHELLLPKKIIEHQIRRIESDLQSKAPHVLDTHDSTNLNSPSSRVKRNFSFHMTTPVSSVSLHSANRAPPPPSPPSPPPSPLSWILPSSPISYSPSWQLPPAPAFWQLPPPPPPPTWQLPSLQSSSNPWQLPPPSLWQSQPPLLLPPSRHTPPPLMWPWPPMQSPPPSWKWPSIESPPPPPSYINITKPENPQPLYQYILITNPIGYQPSHSNYSVYPWGNSTRYQLTYFKPDPLVYQQSSNSDRHPSSPTDDKPGYNIPVETPETQPGYNSAIKTPVITPRNYNDGNQQETESEPTLKQEATSNNHVIDVESNMIEPETPSSTHSTEKAKERLDVLRKITDNRRSLYQRDH